MGLNNTDRTETYALFEDSTFDRIVLREIFDREDTLLPVDKDIKTSIGTGTTMVRYVLHNLLDYRKTQEAIYCSFGDKDNNYLVKGASAGLAFALKYVQLCAKKINKELHFSIAATGTLLVGDDKVEIGYVENIGQKVEAALRCLKEGDKLFIPQKNYDEVKYLQSKIEEKNICFHAVDSLEETICILLNIKKAPESTQSGNLLEEDDPRGRSSPPFRKRVFALITLILSAILFFAWYLMSDANDKQVEIWVEHGEFEKALECCDDTDRGIENTTGLEKICYKLLMDTLTLDVDFRANRPLKIPLDKEVFTPQDRYRFVVTSSDTCYVYIFQFDSQTGLWRLFPDDDFGLEPHHLQGSITYTIPPGGNRFHLKENTPSGKITIYFIASFWRARDLEDIFDNHVNATISAEKAKYSRELRARIMEWMKVKEELNIPGIDLIEVQFLK